MAIKVTKDSLVLVRAMVTDEDNEQVTTSGPIEVPVKAIVDLADGGGGADITPTPAPTITVGESFDQTELQGHFDALVNALKTAGVLTE